MKYCPVDGAEYREGFTHCDEHDVDLVDEPPEVAPETTEPVLVPGVLRGLFVMMIASSVVYVISSAIDGFLFSFGRDEDPTWMFRLQEVAIGASRVTLGILGIMIGTLVFKLLGLFTAEGRRPTMTRGAFSAASPLMRALFVIFIAAASIWAVSGVMTSSETGKYQVGPFGPEPDEGPSDLEIALFSVNIASYAVGLSSFTVMGARLALDAHTWFRGGLEMGE